MCMEAVIDSSENWEKRNPEVEQPPVSGGSTMSVEPSNKDDSHASSHEISKPMKIESSLLNHSVDSTASTISTASDVCESLKAESSSISVIPSSVLPSLSSNKIQPPLDSSSVAESDETESTSACNDSSASLQSSFDTDISHNTKATVTVVKNPSSHVLHGLMRRWDFNLFRIGHSR